MCIYIYVYMFIHMSEYLNMRIHIYICKLYICNYIYVYICKLYIYIISTSVLYQCDSVSQCCPLCSPQCSKNIPM